MPFILFAVQLSKEGVQDPYLHACELYDFWYVLPTFWDETRLIHMTVVSSE